MLKWKIGNVSVTRVVELRDPNLGQVFVQRPGARPVGW